MPGSDEPRALAPTAFYSIADSGYFLGAVALLNSLRLLGHDEPFFLVDCGLEDVQREQLAPHVTLVPAPPSSLPHLLTCAVPLSHPAEVMILLDADLIVTRSLAALVYEALAGKVVAFADAVSHRFHPEWGALLELGPVRRQPYVNAGLLVLPRPLGTQLLELVQAGQERVDVRLSLHGGGRPSHPFYYLDQDVWNAVLAARTQPDEIVILDHRLAPHPPFRGLRLIDETALRSRYADGTEPYALHHIQRKPWLAATRTNIYSRLLSRLLLAPDLALRLEVGQVPVRLRPGRLAWVERRRADLLAVVRAQRGRLGLRRRLANRRAR